MKLFPNPFIAFMFCLLIATSVQAQNQKAEETLLQLAVSQPTPENWMAIGAYKYQEAVTQQKKNNAALASEFLTEAQDFFTMAIGLDPKRTATYVQIAQLIEKQNVVSALFYWKKAEATNANHVPTLEALIRIYQEIRLPNEASIYEARLKKAGAGSNSGSVNKLYSN